MSQELQLELTPGKPEWSGSLRAKVEVRRSTRRFVLLLSGASPARVELNDRHGPVRLSFGWAGRDSLLVETAAPLAPGPAGLNVAWIGKLSAGGRGPRVARRGGIELVPGAGGTLARWPGVAPATPWRVFVQAPANCTARSPLQQRSRSLRGDWQTWEFVSAQPMPADSLALSVRTGPATPARPAHRHRKRRGAAR